MNTQHPAKGSVCSIPRGGLRVVFAVALGTLFWVHYPTAFAQPAPSSSAAQPQVSERYLPPLPEVPSIELGDPSPESVVQVSHLLERLLGDDDEDRRAAATEVRTVAPNLVAAINRRIDSIAERADRQSMKRLLSDIRGAARDEIRVRMRAEGKKGEIETPDYFDMVVAHPRLDDESWQDLVRILALSRMLVAIESIDATRTLVRIYVRFDFLRIDTQLQLEKLGDRSVAALIEARRHKAKKVAEWAERQLDLMGRAIPSEAVQINDYGALADVLRAYGRIKDPDAARIVVSFANSERAQVREAARQAVALMGEVGNWQLRDTYENTVGKRPPRDWSWQRTARELFRTYDRLRLAHVYDLFDQGQAAHQRGHFDQMRADYDKVLARSPMFERRAEMASGYFDYAKAKADSDLDEAISALYRAERITPKDDASRPRIRSLLLTLEGERLMRQGIADQELFQRALDLDPTNERAKRSFDVARRGEQAVSDERHRWVGAVVIGVVALVAILLIVLWPRRQRDERQEAVTRAEPDPFGSADDNKAVVSDTGSADEPLASDTGGTNEESDDHASASAAAAADNTDATDTPSPNDAETGEAVATDDHSAVDEAPATDNPDRKDAPDAKTEKATAIGDDATFSEAPSPIEREDPADGQPTEDRDEAKADDEIANK